MLFCAMLFLALSPVLTLAGLLALILALVAVWIIGN
jgi:hypothetical protein